jgi:hypothetical protein
MPDYTMPLNCSQWQSGDIKFSPKGLIFLQTSTPNLGSFGGGTTSNTLVPSDPNYVSSPNTFAVFVCESDDPNTDLKKALKGFVTFNP